MKEYRIIQLPIKVGILAMIVAFSALSAEKQKTVLFFGDSITAGGRWVKSVGDQLGVHAVNAGRSGRRAAWARKELEPYLRDDPNPDLIVMFLGVNDLPARDPRPSDEKVAGCVKDMTAAIDLALKSVSAQKIVLVAPCDVNPETMSQTNKRKGYQIAPPLLKKLESGYRQLAKEKGVHFFSLLKTVSKENYRDGLHPNADGDKEIAEAFTPFLPTVMPKATRPSAVKGWPEAVKDIKYPASIDKSLQPMLMFKAKGTEKRPLLVGLHTWSGGYKQAGGEVVYARWCMERNWNFIHPHFRGPNKTPDACGSEKVVQDIIDAVAYARATCAVDTNRVYLAGVSGGGYAALLMAARAPDLWAGVSAWASISDIYAWWRQKTADGPARYARDIEKAVGGNPDDNEQAMRECVKRSPLTYLQNAGNVHLDINAGIYDGHKGGSVPFTHSLHAFNKVMPKSQRIDDKLIDEFYQNQAPPPALGQAEPDPLYGSKPVIFRKIYKNTRVTVFKGGHTIIHEAALNWLAAQRKDKSAIWTLNKSQTIKTSDSESQSGK